MIVKAEVVYHVNVTMDIPEETNPAKAKLLVLLQASKEFVAENFEKKIVKCIERPEIVDL